MSIDRDPTQPAAAPEPTAAPPPAADTPPAGAGALPGFAWRPVALLTLATMALLAATAHWYGFHRDELYFRVLSRHLDWGYVDQPPLVPLLIRASTEVFGDSLLALRLPAIILGPLAIAVLALLARELGGGRAAQLLAAGCGACAYVLISGHTFLTSTLDIPISGLVLLFTIRALLRDEPRWWLLVGLLLGLSFYNKELLPLLFVGVAAGLVIAGPRRALLSRWLWLGVLIAVLVGLPNLIYQVTHDFPQLTMGRALSEHKGGENRALFFPMQFLLWGPPVAALWIAGWIRLLRDPRWRPLRAFAWAYPLIAVFVFVTGSGFYYPFGLMLPLVAAGCVVSARWAAGRRGRWALLVAAVVVSDVVGSAVAVPLVPVGTLRDTPIGAINQTARDQIGWPTYVSQLAAVYAQLPESDRSRAVILTSNYGEYGAVDFYGPAYGLPPVYAGQNQLFEYGPPPQSATVVVAVGFDNPARLQSVFGSCEQAGELDNGVDVDNEEQQRTIWVCRDLIQPWSTVWERFHHYD